MPRTDLPPISIGKSRNIERIADWHHPFHPRLVLISEGVGAVAVRNCRIQWTEYDDHHHKYHGAYVGPELPEDADEQFRTVVFAAAGYIPQQTIGFGRFKKPIIRNLNDDQRNLLWQSGQLRIANLSCIRDFLLEYALAGDLSRMNESTIDEFLSTKNTSRKKELGSNLLAIAAYNAAEPVEDSYKESRKLHLIPPDRARTAGRFIFGTMNTHRRTRAMAALTARFTAA